MLKWKSSTRLIFVVGILFAQLDSVQAQSFEQDIAVQSGGEQIAATLICPSKEGPFPCIVITHGSEAGVRPQYRKFAQRFIDRGFSVVVYDKRGCGDSTGTYVEAPDLQVPAGDMVACVEAVAKNDLVDASRIGVFGVSQGGWVGPLAASKSNLISFVIMISGPSISPLEQNLFDKGNQLKGGGYDEDEIENVTNLRRLVWTYLTNGDGKEEAQKAWDEAKSESWFRAFKNQIPMGDRVQLLRHPRLTHFAAHSRYDPEPTLRALQVPVLAVYGNSDTIVPAKRCADLLDSFFQDERKSLLTIKRIEGADHGIRVQNESGRRDFAVGYLIKLFPEVGPLNPGLNENTPTPDGSENQGVLTKSGLVRQFDERAPPHRDKTSVGSVAKQCLCVVFG